MKTMETVEELRVSGNELYKQGKFAEAVEKYSDALAIEPANHLLYSNRSLAQCSAGNFKEAMEDAESCLKIDDKFMKGYYRLANAQVGLELFDDAQTTIRKGLALDSDNPELKKMMRIVKAKRDTSKRSVRNPNRAGMDEDTRKHMAELGENITNSQRELNETVARVNACKREMQRGQLCQAEVEALSEDASMYRSIGKMFLKQDKTLIKELLVEQAGKGNERISALTSRQALLERNINNWASELKSMQESA